MFEEFNHFFQEELYDLYIDGGIFLEAYSKKEEHRVRKFLKENKFEEDPNATTAEEKRKGYKRGTIETDILDENGKKKRVNFEINPHTPDAAYCSHDRDEQNPDNVKIVMSKKMASRKPAISNFIFKHEEGHAAVYLDKSGKYVMEMKEVDKILTRLLHKMLTTKNDTLTDHDKRIEEFIADKYAFEHNRYKNNSKFGLKDEYGDMTIDIHTKQAAKALVSLMSTDNYTKKMLKMNMNGLIRSFIPEIADNEIKFLRDKIKNCRNHISNLQKSVMWNEQLVSMLNDTIEHGKQTLINEQKWLANTQKEIDKKEQRVYSIINAYASDLNNDLIEARENGIVLTKKERQKKVRKMYEIIYAKIKADNLNEDVRQYASFTTGIKDLDAPNTITDYNKHIKDILNENRKAIISSKKLIDADIKMLTDFVNVCKAHKNDIKETKEEIKKIYDELDKINDLVTNKTGINSVDISERCKKIINLAEMHASRETVSSTELDMSTAIRVLMCLPKDERDKFAKQVHDTTIEVAKLEKAAENRKEITTESYVDDNDDTSGTSDFNTSNDTDPDDCYCESANDSFLNEYKEYVSEMVDDFLQDSFDIISEAKENHVLIDKRKHRDVDGYNRSAIIYKGDKDVDDIKLIKAFINSHRKMIKTPHSADIDEYLADLNSARETSFKSMINTLTELYLPEDKKNLKGLKKYHYEDLKNQIIINHDNMSKSPKDITHRIDHPSKETYETNKRRFNSVIGKDPRGFIAKDSVDLKNKLTQFKKIYETYESYVNYVRSHDVDIDSVITSYIDAYNSDLDMRIAFLKYAKDIFSPRRKPSPDQIKEYCVNDPLNELMQQQGIVVDDTSRKSNGTWIDVIQEFSNCLRSKLDMAKYSEESFNEIFDDLLHYTFIMEAAMDENMNENANKEPQPYQESKLPAKKRNSLKDSDFALVYTDEKGKKVRKYPVHDKAHVESAARMFGHCPLKYKAKLARKILSRAHEYGIDTSGWTQVNKFSKSK